ncbi:hypothetical protein KAU32_00835 [bacterium]|nr:hypothetical protein [bacterium]
MKKSFLVLLFVALIAGFAFADNYVIARPLQNGNYQVFACNETVYTQLSATDKLVDCYIYTTELSLAELAQLGIIGVYSAEELLDEVNFSSFPSGGAAPTPNVPMPWS